MPDRVEREPGARNPVQEPRPPVRFQVFPSVMPSTA